jgi:hypothetical protein
MGREINTAESGVQKEVECLELSVTDCGLTNLKYKIQDSKEILNPRFQIERSALTP